MQSKLVILVVTVSACLIGCQSAEPPAPAPAQVGTVQTKQTPKGGVKGLDPNSLTVPSGGNIVPGSKVGGGN